MNEAEKINSKLAEAQEKIKILEKMVEDRTLVWYSEKLERQKQQARIDELVAKEFAEQEIVQKALINIMQDIKAEKQKVDMANKQYILINKELEQFAFVASHDFQEPLRTITNFIELLEKKFSNSEDKSIHIYMKFITDAAAKMRVIIRDLLDFSYIGNIREKVSVDCNKTLQEVKESLDFKIRETGLNIKSTWLPTVEANEGDMTQLFMNLITNGIKYQKNGNTPEIDISFEEKNGDFLFRFSDNGIGIEPQYFERIFILFQRLHKVSEYPGTGIGLATCKKIVDCNNGKIWVESEKGKGSSFFFTIPKQVERN